MQVRSPDTPKGWTYFGGKPKYMSSKLMTNKLTNSQLSKLCAFATVPIPKANWTVVRLTHTIKL